MYSIFRYACARKFYFCYLCVGIDLCQYVFNYILKLGVSQVKCQKCSAFEEQLLDLAVIVLSFNIFYLQSVSSRFDQPAVLGVSELVCSKCLNGFEYILIFFPIWFFCLLVKPVFSYSW